MLSGTMNVSQPGVFRRPSERQVVRGVAHRFGVGESHRIDGVRVPDTARAPYLAGRAGASRHAGFRASRWFWGGTEWDVREGRALSHAFH